MVHHFTYGPLTPVLAYVMSCIGCALGLLCTSRARGVTGRARWPWLGLAALSIGGTGIWVMHFIAMLGFTVSGQEIRFDVPITLLSAAVAIVFVGIGLLLVGTGREGTPRLCLAGVITGLGVASMHYIGMSAMRMSGTMHYDPLLVALSVVIGVVAATAGLWFALRVRGGLATLGATLIMGIAVCGMHYTGMAAMTVTMDPDMAMPVSGGVTAENFFIPLIVAICIFAMFVLTIILMTPGEAELRREQELERRVVQRPAPVPAPVPAPAYRDDAPPANEGSAWFTG